MLRKRGVVAALLAAVAATAAAVAATATAMTNAPAARANADTALVKCGKTRSFGLLAPITGPAASLGGLQVDWVQYYVSKWNATHKTAKLKIVKGDTVLGGPGGTAEAVKAAQSFGSNLLGVLGPAGSNEVRATTATLKYKRVYIIDDQEAYSTGLADTVQSKLRSAGVTVQRDGVSQQQSDFSSLIAKIPRDYQLVYIPWQLPPKGKAFGQQLRAAGKGNITLMGSDGLFDSEFASLNGVYASSFPTSASHPIVKAFKRAHGGNAEFFGGPSYVAAQGGGGAIQRACKNGTASRAEVRAQIRKTNLKKTVLGLNVRFNRNGDIAGGRFG